MSNVRGRTWWIYGACAAAVTAAMAWITVLVLSLESGEARARAESEHQSALRLGLWRMDSWLAPQLARETARPYFEYRAYYPQQKAYTKLLSEIEPGEVLTPSPLLTFRSELFRLHFQLCARAGLTSPQVPTGNLRDLAEATTPDDGSAFDDRAEVLQEIAGFVRLPDLAARLSNAEDLPGNCLALTPPAGTAAVVGASPLVQEPQQTFLLQQDYQSRAQTTNLAKNAYESGAGPAPLGAEEVSLGPLLPLWLADATGTREHLLFVRRVRVQHDDLYQGFLADWPRLREALLAQIPDLFPAGDASLSRQDDPSADEQDRMLATVPVLLTAEPAPSTRAPWSTTRSVLVTAWLAMLLAVLAVGVTLRSTIAFGDRRARFASAVTHELRTPLTTFRMYSEMLADDMVRDPAQRTRYLRTLTAEADRLSRLVENVLSYARLEEGRHRSRPERISVADLIARVAEPLRRRTSEADMELRIEISDGDLHLDVDTDAVAQVLFNLVDNACKYARGSEPAVIELTVRAADGVALIAVRDHGPGIPQQHRRGIFRPFERGARASEDNVTPGVGLGLALARGLAEDLGGALDADPDIADGARFVLRLPQT